MPNHHRAYTFFVFVGLFCLCVSGCPGPSGNLAPQADDQSVTVAFNSPKTITLTADDPDSSPQALTYSVVSQPQHGALTGTPPGETYTPATGYSGPDGFTFKASDGAAESNTATVSITVLPPGGDAAGSRFQKYRGSFQLSWRDEVQGAVRTCDVSGMLEFADPVESATDFAPGTTFAADSAASSVDVTNFSTEAPGVTCNQAGAGFEQRVEIGQLIIKSSPDEYALVLVITFLTDGTCAPGGPYNSVGTRPQVGFPLDAACAGPKFVAIGPDSGHLAGAASWTGCTDSPPYESFTATLTWDLVGE
ncbi:hypothetical protein RAS1_21620 [Phycisphaerae bacterium RAS1]|nr:hypothetical protein RAS1_21620 [Phycisphaerae bacterium RAS1]